MTWLALGATYSILYALFGAYLRPYPGLLPWFRIGALLVPPLVAAVVIAQRRQVWSGCQWLFWATLSLGLAMSGIGVVGWTIDEILLGRSTSWLGWHAVFALFGAVAPLLALLAQPHRGVRERIAATTAVDIAGIAVLTGFLYSRFVVDSDPSGVQTVPASLLLLSELQQFLVCLGLGVATILASHPGWKRTYRRLALGAFISFVTVTLSNTEIWQGMYQSASLADAMWILPFAFYPWAASAAPTSLEAGSDPEDEQTTPSRPWVIFAGLGLLPLIDYGLRRAAPLGPLNAFYDLSTAVAIVSVLPLLMARLAVERAELRQVDAELRLLAAAIEQADEQILIVTGDDRVHHANEAFCRATGYTTHELRSIVPSRLLARDSVSKLAELRQSLGEGHVWRGTLVRQRKDGSVYQASSTVVPLADKRGDFTHFVRIEHDITDELRMRDQLIHSERLSAVGQLVSGVAHELNNPLQSILGFTELLMDAEDRPALRRDLEQVRSEAVRAGKIVRNLLAFARRSPTERSLGNINDIVRTTLALRSYEFGSANITLDERYAEDLPPVLVNREEVQQVVLNLVLNAEQAMRSSRQGGTLSVKTECTAEGAVVVEVKDDGPGVPAALAGRVFEPFFSTKGAKGSGLGLWVSSGIVQAHGGSLQVRSVEGRGTVFTIVLPVEGPPKEATTGDLARPGSAA